MTELQCPVIYYENNLIFDNTRACWGVYKLNGVNYDNRSEESKLDILRNLTRVIASIVDECKAFIVLAVLYLYECSENKTKDGHDGGEDPPGEAADCSCHRYQTGYLGRRRE